MSTDLKEKLVSFRGREKIVAWTAVPSSKILMKNLPIKLDAIQVKGRHHRPKYIDM